ncbi:cadherin-related family member 5 [Ochotona curzoniae]|uniref:cadherin-related family member 5 n=1 Tax=Ochotona curzoniae TaxID=130825 RepID=UPI001B3458B3|nr:cadherin-related family member 5 [Ochotona curzoniae]
MGAWPQLWPPLALALLLTALLGQPPGAEAQGCSVSPTLVEIEENTNRSEPLANLTIPDGQQVVLGPSTTAGAFRIAGTELFLNVVPDYEATPWLQAELQCFRGSTLVTTLSVNVIVLDVNDNAPQFPFSNFTKSVDEDTKVNTTIIPEEELEAHDDDQNDILFYTLRELTQGASSFFSLAAENRPALKLTQTLDYDKFPNMALELLARDTWEENQQPSHTATATLVLTVVPSDLRPPWFLPCSFSDGHVCIQAQYYGAVPTGHTLSEPLVLRPGPIYAKDGDTAIGQRIIYSLLSGNQDDTFTIDEASGNLTMAKSVPRPMTFLLVVKGEQEDLARYSVTQVTVEARAATGSTPYFAQTLYRGIVAPGSTVGVAVQDAAAPPEPLRIQAQDDDFPDFNSAITYRVTNCSEFRMDGEALLTASSELPQDHVFYCEVEAKNMVTESTATTVVEIRVSVQNPLPTEPSGYSARDMAALGGTLGGLLLLALVGLVFLSLKLYGHQLKCCARKVLEPAPRGFDNQSFQSEPDEDDNASLAPTPDAEPAPPSLPVADPDPAPPRPGAPAAPVSAQGSPEAVRSILTKERRPEGGYKAVWFGEDIGAEADVVVLNTPGMDGTGADADDDDDPEYTYI